jgi:D-amino-acid dehydrogenase
MAGEVIIVGGGYIGLHSAYRLHELGYRVRVYAGDLGRAASWGNAGIIHQGSITAVPEVMGLLKLIRLTLRRDSYISIRPSFALREVGPRGWLMRYVSEVRAGRIAAKARVLQRLLLESRGLWLEVIKKEGLDAELNESGSIEVFVGRENFEHESEFRRKESAELGYRVEVLDGDQCREIEPLLSKQVVGGLLYPDDLWINPQKTIYSFADALRRKGIEVIERFVESVEVEDGRANVLTGEGKESPDVVLVCAGAWTRNVLRSAGVRVPVVAGRGYLAVTEPSQHRISRPVICADQRTIVGQTRAGEFRISSYFELSSPDAPPDNSKFERMRRWSIPVLPVLRDLKFKITWVGSRPCTPDGLPVIGKIRGTENLYVAAGHCRLGATLSAATGKLVAEMIEGKEPEMLRELSPERFS